MNKVKGVISVIGIIVKYSAVVMAIIKGIEVIYQELEKIDFSEKKQIDG
ncbi:hypothetical protein [Flavobacterium gawalongense]|nr:hypothetical protein [Flavobacterium gawalongense]